MEIEFYPEDEKEFKEKCKNSGELLWAAYKDKNIFYHYETQTKGFDSPLGTYLKTLQIKSVKVRNIEGISKIRAFASNDFLQEKGNNLEKILFSDEFYFEKIKPLLEEFLSYEINDDKVNKIIDFVRKNKKFDKLLEGFQSEKYFLELLAKIIAISDHLAAGKTTYNPYDNNRTIGGGLYQNQWVEGFLNYKLTKISKGIIKNLLDYIKKPLDSTSVLSESHRNKISQQLFRKNYEANNFTSDLKKYFEENKFYVNVKNPNNLTIYMTSILYDSLKNKWNGKSKGENMIDKELQEKVDLLKHKKQIILQGSPGTGKTRLAKEIAKQVAVDNYKLIQFHPAYTYEDFVRGIVATTTDGVVSYEVQNKVLAEMAENANKEYKVAKDENREPEKFVLIIDEINRANLSAVLGELIYGLEYRGNAVESMYKLGDSREIILPENLYIIGTMNTADRSVGYIDYAIRRRFAFVNVGTDESIIPANAKNLFATIKALFDEKLSEEFEKDDVMIGHSYFLQDNDDDLELALEYEIKPILQEYRKDGVLTCEKSDIDNLNVN